jgi:hypothetical protein
MTWSTTRQVSLRTPSPPARGEEPSVSLSLSHSHTNAHTHRPLTAQTVTVEYTTGQTASFIMSAFTEHWQSRIVRQLRLPSPPSLGPWADHAGETDTHFRDGGRAGD